MTRRKQGITPLTVFKLFHSISSKYNPNGYSRFVATRTKEIRDKGVEASICSFLNRNKYDSFSGSVLQLEDYIEFCFQNNLSIYFYNLGQHISDWKKNRMKGDKPELLFLFADKIIKYMRDKNISFKEYIECKPKNIPIILQHYMSTKDIPFETILYLKILEKCSVDKRRLRLLFSREYNEMERYISNMCRLNEHIRDELIKVIKDGESI